MLTKKHTKKQPGPAPVPMAKTIEKRRRRHKPALEPMAVTVEPKTVTQLIFENRRAQLDRLNEEIQRKVLET